MKLEDLKGNPKNPRKVTEAKLAQLKRSLEEFGDLGGVVWNRRTKRLVSGHQRLKGLGFEGKVSLTCRRRVSSVFWPIFFLA